MPSARPSRGSSDHPGGIRPASRSSPAGLPVDHPSELDRDSWTAPVAARRLHPLDDTDHTAAAQTRALLARLPAGRGRAAVGGRRRRRFRPAHPRPGRPAAGHGAGAAAVGSLLLRRPPPRPPGATGRPRRHGATFACPDPTTWPTPTTSLVGQDDQDGAVTGPAWSGGIPPSSAIPATAPVGHDRSCPAHPPRPGPTRPRPDAAADGAVAVAGRPSGRQARPCRAGGGAPLRPGAHRPVRQPALGWTTPRPGHPAQAER
jgi:hypothetical protein